MAHFWLRFTNDNINTVRAEEKFNSHLKRIGGGRGATDQRSCVEGGLGLLDPPEGPGARGCVQEPLL